MKIGIVILHCLGTHASRYVNEVGRYFIERGHELHVFANRWDNLDPRIIVHKIPVLPLNGFWKELSFMLMATLILKLYKFDVTMAQATRYFSPDVCYMQFVYKEWINFKKRNGLPFAFPDLFVPRMEGWNGRRAKRVIVMSNIIKNEMIENYRVPEDNISIIYSGADLDRFNPSKKATVRDGIRKRLGLNAGDIVMILVGNPYRRKGLEYAIRALPSISDKRAKLLVLGRNSEDDRIEDYKKLAKSIGVSERLVYGGFRGDVENYYAASDIFLLPTLYEPFGLVILEALASGLPVVTSKIAGASELIDDGKEGFLLKDPKDFGEIAEKINALIDKKLMKSIGNAARRKAKCYTWDRTADGFLGVFEGVADEKNG